MIFMKKKQGRLFLAFFVCVALLLCAFPRPAFARDFSQNVSSHSDIVAAIATAVPGDHLTLVLQNSLMLGGTPAISIPSGVNVTMTNQPGVAVTVTRYWDFAGFGASSKIDIWGSLTVRQDTTGGGSLTFDGGNRPCGGNPQFVANGGSKLTIESGTFQNQRSEFGVIYSVDGATLTINDGTFQNNRSDWQGGVIWAANCDVAINGGTFDQNTSATIGGVLYYDGRVSTNKLSVTGGVFTKNKANGGFGGGVFFIDCTGPRTVVEISAGTFTENSSSTWGGAIYVQDGAVVQMANSSICGNTATIDGGGVWNCPTGGGNYYTFHGMYLAGNAADIHGDDFYSQPKTDPDIKIYLTDYAFTGDKFNWEYDDGSPRTGSPAPNDYYQDTSTEIALKSGLSGTAAAGITFSQNHAGSSGGAIANNGKLQIGEATGLAIRKDTTAPTTESFQFRIRLTKNGAALPGSFLYESSGSTALTRIVFDQTGTGVLSLNAGQTITILDMPGGAHAVVTETNLPNGWVLRSPNDVSGDIPAVAVKAPLLQFAFTNGLVTDPVNSGDVPKTGDRSLAALWLALAACSAAGIAGITLCYRKKSCVSRRCK